MIAPRNKRLAAWLAGNVSHRLSYLVNNNPNGVIQWLANHGATVQDVNQDGSITTNELYAALVTYANANHGGVDAFLQKAGAEIKHNDNAPAEWNLLKAQ